MHSFTTEFSLASERFRDSAASAGCLVESHNIGVVVDGPNGDLEQPGIEVASYRPKHSDRLVIVTSGVHGVEAPLGSAVQSSVLECFRNHAPDCSIVLVHVLNPYGFYHGRRFDEHNVDLNRNFLRDDEAYSGSPDGYRQLDPLLNPVRITGSDCFKLKAAWQVYRNGMAQMQQAVASGQYDFPSGIFFGGSGPSMAHKWMREQLPCWVSGIRQVTHLDFHTGLGRWAKFMLMLEAEPEPHELNWLQGLADASIKHPEGKSAGYTARGSFGSWCKDIAELEEYLFVTAECGTYPPIDVLAALRAENFWFHQMHGQLHDTDAADHVRKQYSAAKRRLQRVFIPRSERWRRNAVAQGVEFVLAALDRNSQ